MKINARNLCVTWGLEGGPGCAFILPWIWGCLQSHCRDHWLFALVEHQDTIALSKIRNESPTELPLVFRATRAVI
jgi:hypothetical protein